VLIQIIIVAPVDSLLPDCETSAIDRPDKGLAKVIDPRIMSKQKNKKFEITTARRLRYLTLYFIDSDIIGSKAFVSTHYQRIQHLFASKKSEIGAGTFFTVYLSIKPASTSLFLLF
jgi:hypothetical protein